MNDPEVQVVTRRVFLVVACSTLLFVASAATAEGPEDILVVVNSSAPVDETTAAEIRNIFLKKKSAWRTGDSALPVHAPDGTALRERFRERLLKMSATEEHEYWKNAKIKQALIEPPAYSNTLKAVFKLRGAVSYVFRSDYKEGVAKVVLVLPSS